jgi:Cdc6-like AAA superfamily ATPase
VPHLLPHRIETYANELYESTDVQDIPAGAITLQIDIKDCDEQLETFASKKTNKRKGSKEENIFCCRFLCTEAMDSLLPVETSDIWKRSLRYSDYSHIYLASFPQEEPTQDASSYDPYSIAIAQLHVSFIPDTMPCRQDEHRKILDFLTKQLSQTSSSKKVTHGKSKAKGQKSNQSSSDQTENARASGGSEPLYLSGMTGTGKTATVFASLTSLSKLKEELSLPDYSFIEINGLRLSSPQEAYSLLWKGISGEQVAPRTALQRLKEYFSVRKIGNEGNDPLKENEDGSDEYYICLLDELDFLITSNEAVIYNILDWSQSKNSGLILIGIANTMDLPDRLSKKSQSRMGGAFRRISFRPYTFDQILQILTDRLQNLHGIFEGKILELVARKAAACSGDLRSALKICQRFPIPYLLFLSIVDLSLGQSSFIEINKLIELLSLQFHCKW